MASYAKFIEKIGKGNIESAYTNVLTDVNYCIHLFEDLEIGRTTTESWFDSFAGERKEVDLEHLPSNLKILKKEIEIGLQLYMKLSCKMNILNNKSSQESKPRSIMHSDQTTRWGIEQELRSQFEELLSTVSGIKIQENRRFKNDWLSYIPGVVSYRDRTTHYSEARILYQALNQDKILSVLKENHASINELIWCIDDAIRNVNNLQHHNPSDISAEYHETSQQENSPENPEFDTVLNSVHDNHIDNTPSVISVEYHETSQRENSPENNEFDTVLNSEHDHHIDNTPSVISVEYHETSQRENSPENNEFDTVLNSVHDNHIDNTPSVISVEYHETSQQENSPENPEFDTVLNSVHDNHIDNTEPDNSSSPKGTEVIVEQLCVAQQADCTQNSKPDIDENYLARAKYEYNAVLTAELEELDSTEKGLSEETRIRIAKREAVRSCKRFLKEELKFSNSIADEYVKTIQASSL